jgi:calcineurin-like phosphoesterase family protein
MYNIHRYDWSDRNRHYFSSDWHNFHDPKSWDVPIWKSRGYSSPLDAAKNVQDTINSRVGEDDVLHYLGDGFLNASEEGVVEWFAGIKCRNIRYHFGNHESIPYRLYREEVIRQFGRTDIEVYPLRLGNILFVGNHSEIHIGRQRIILNHFPLRIWNKHLASQRPSIMLSGHSHNKDWERNPDSPAPKALDVGWDWKLDVWSFGEIMEVMSTKTSQNLPKPPRT